MCRPSSSLALVLALVLALAAGPAAAQTGAPPPVAGAAKATLPAPPSGVAPAQTASPSAATPNTPAAPAPPSAAAVEPPASSGGLLVPGSGFRYDPTGRRDPFKSLLQLEKKQRDLSQLPPIQQFDIESARVVGIVIDPVRGAQAMVRAPNGQTFVVRKGTVIGKNEGEVVEITMQGIRVVEKFLDFMNRETRKETFLKSHPTAGK